MLLHYNLIADSDMIGLQRLNSFLSSDMIVVGDVGDAGIPGR